MSRGCLTLTSTVRESMIHIIEPVASEVVNYIVQHMGYEKLFKDNIEIVSDFRSTSKTTDENHNALIRHDRVRVKLNPNVDPRNNKWEGNGTTIDLGNGNALITNPHAGNATRTPWKRPSYPDQMYNIFADSENYIRLRDMSVGTTLTMEMNMEFKHATDAQEALSRLYQTFINGDMVHSIDLQYDYPIPEEIQATLLHLFDLRGPRPMLGGKDSCLRWVMEGSNGLITLNVNRNNPTHAELVVNKNHFETCFQIECTQEAPTPLQPDGYSINLNVAVQYARANRLILEYPIIVNNSFVGLPYVPMDPQYRDDKSTPASLVMWENPAYTAYWLSMYAKDRRPYKYPWYDPWTMPENSHPGANKFKPIITCAFELDDAENPEGVTEIDLIDGLPGVNLSDEIKGILAKEKANVLDVDGNVNVSVFADDWIMDRSLLEFDGRTLIVKKRGLKSVCRLVISTRDVPKTENFSGKRVWVTTIFPMKDSTYERIVRARGQRMPPFGTYMVF